MGKALSGNGARQLAVLALGMLAAGIAAGSASAADCPGNLGALGTSRTLVVDPREHPRIGTMQYAETLPLQDHEVVLTFDDGPLPPHSTQVLDILAAQCIKATFFIIGRMARDYPEGVRKVRDAGHTIGTHSQNHPLGMIGCRSNAPGRRSTTVSLRPQPRSATQPRSRRFSAFPACAAPKVSRTILLPRASRPGARIFRPTTGGTFPRRGSDDLAIKRLEAKGKGILLLHDIQARTVAALPRILHELKARGYRIVHVVPATPELPKTPTEPQQWQLHPPSEAIAISHWPKIPNFVFASAEMLPAPAVSDLDWRDGKLVSLPELLERPWHLARGAVPLPQQTPWPRFSPLQAGNAEITLPVPAKDIFDIQEKSTPPTQQALVPSAHHAERTQASARNDADAIAKLISIHASASRRMIPGSHRISEPGLKRVPLTTR